MTRQIGLAVVAGVATMVFGLGPLAQTSLAAPLKLSANQTSTSFAGYLTYVAQPGQPSPTPTTFRFTVPSLTCSSTNTGIWIGAAIEYLGRAGVQEECLSSAAVYVGQLEVDSTFTPTSFTPAPGDVMVVKVLVTATMSKSTLEDLTQDKSQSDTGTGGSAGEIADGVDVLTGLPIADFGKLHIDMAKELFGSPVGRVGTAYSLVSNGGTLQVETGTPNSTDKGWTETFKHS